MYKRDIRTITRHTPRGPKRVRVAMGAWTDLAQKDCGPDQRYDPDAVYAGIKGQCVTSSQYDSYPHAAPSSSGGGFWDNLAAGLASALKPGQSAQAPVIVQGGGISTTTALAIGGGALLLVVLLTRK